MTIVLISLQLILLAEDLLKLFLTLDLKGCSLYERLLRQIKIRDSFIVRDRLIDFLDLLPDYVADLIFGDIAVKLGHFLIRILDLNSGILLRRISISSGKAFLPFLRTIISFFLPVRKI